MSAGLPLLVGSVVGALTKPLVVLTDGGTWYNVLDRLGVIWLVYKVLRSYIERFFQHYSQFLSMVVFIILSVVPVVLIPFMDPLTFQFSSPSLFILYYNFYRPHQTLKLPPLGSLLPRRRW